MNTVRPLYKLLGTWRTASDVGTARRAAPQEVNGLQAHAIVRHGVSPLTAFSTSIDELVSAHATAHAEGVRHWTVA